LLLCQTNPASGHTIHSNADSFQPPFTKRSNQLEKSLNASREFAAYINEGAYHRETGEIVAYVWGKRDLATVKRLKVRLKQLGVSYVRIASDHWDSFVTAFKCSKQVIDKFFTVGIEGNNCRLRHRIRHGLRRSCNFSKNLEN
jgi:IS1 family transposase